MVHDRRRRKVDAAGGEGDTVGAPRLPVIPSTVEREKLSVLLVEDSTEDARRGLLALRDAGYSLHWRHVRDVAGMAAALADQAWDLVLCAHHLPHLDSLEAVRALRENGAATPLILLSATVSEELAATVVREGAADHVSTDDLGRLGAVVKLHLREVASRRAQEVAEEALHESKELFAQGFEHSPIGMALTGLDGTFRGSTLRLRGCLATRPPRRSPGSASHR